MSLRPPLFVVLLTVSAIVATAQTTDPNPGHTPDVFLDNHRPLNAKKGKAPTTRNVSGKVTDENGQPLDGALVTLTDTKTNNKLTFITKKEGRYNFEELSFNIDYVLQARYKDQQGGPRKLSQYDHAPNVVRILQIGSLDTEEPSGSAAPKRTGTDPNHNSKPDGQQSPPSHN